MKNKDDPTAETVDPVTGKVTATWNFGSNQITIELEPLPSKPTALRPVFVVATVGGQPRPKDQNQPSSVPDAAEWQTLKDRSYEAGHLVANFLGGPDHPYNLVPMTKGVNSKGGTWGLIEAKLQDQLRNAAPGETVELSVALIYDDADPRIPQSITGGIRINDGTPNGRNDEVIEADLAEPEDKTKLTDEIIQLFGEIDYEAWYTYQIKSTQENPNAPLDIVDKSSVRSQNFRNRLRLISGLDHYPIGGIPRKRTVGDITPEQRKLVLLYNRYRDAQLSGRVTAEDVDQLGTSLAEWEAEIDHIHPQSKSHNREYKNLRVMYHRANNAKRGARLDATGKPKPKKKKQSKRFKPY